MNIHIIGIAGAMTASLAKELKRLGHNVTGSDQEKIYPPISDILKEADIILNTTKIDKNIDLVIVGSSYNSFENTRQEFETVKNLRIPYISATQYIAKYLGKPNSILIAGSFGKTTITNLLSWIFINAKFNPSFMFGGDSLNDIDSNKITNSDWSIIEADESIHGLDEQAKFLYYPVKHLILTSADWEHKDSYPTSNDNFQAFKKLIERIPQDGTLLINSRGHQTKELSQYCQSKIITYNSENSDYFISNTDIQKNHTEITIKTPSVPITVSAEILGRFNFENILAAVALSDYLGVNRDIIKNSISSFKGVKRRLELIADTNNILFFDDFAQSAPRIKSVIDSIKLHYPENNIKVYFSPHASFLQYKSGLNELKNAFKDVNEIILSRINFNPKINKIDRVTAKDFQQEIGDKLKYEPIEENIIKHYTKTLNPDDILVHMSSGGSQDLDTFKKIINYFKNLKI